MALSGEDFKRACAEGGRALDSTIKQLRAECAERLLRDARAKLGRIEEVNDVVQETFIKAALRCAQFEGASGVLTWMRAILRNTILDHLRDRAAKPEVPWLGEDDQLLPEVEHVLRKAADDAGFDPEKWALQAERIRVYLECFARFAAAHPKEAVALRWSAEEGWTIDELARQLGKSPGATRTYLSEWRAKLRPFLAPWLALLSTP